MTVEYLKILERIINDGIEAARKDYASEPDKLKGAVAGFAACRGKQPAELAALFLEAQERTRQAFRLRVENYWEIRCYDAEIEWTCNCVSAVLLNQGLPVIVNPTARGMLKAAEVVGVR
jgi:hypothetical protein